MAERIRPAEATLPPEARRLPDDVLAVLRDEARALGLWCIDAPVESEGAARPPSSRSSCGSRRASTASASRSPAAACSGTARRWCSTPARPSRSTAGCGPPSPRGGPASARWPSRRVAPTLPGPSAPPPRGSPTAGCSTAPRRGSPMPTTPSTASCTPVPTRGCSAFVLDTATPGIEVRPIPMLRDSWPCEVRLDGCLVPADALIGEEGAGLALAGLVAGEGPAVVCRQGRGRGRGGRCGWRPTGPPSGRRSARRLATRQAIQFAFADSRVEVNAARLLTWDAAWQADQGRPRRPAGGGDGQAVTPPRPASASSTG